MSSKTKAGFSAMFLLATGLALVGCAADAEDVDEEQVDSEASELVAGAIIVKGDTATSLFRAMKSAGIGGTRAADGTLTRSAKRIECEKWMAPVDRRVKYWLVCTVRESTDQPAVKFRFEGYSPSTSDLPAAKLTVALDAIDRLTEREAGDYENRTVADVRCTAERCRMIDKNR